MDHLREMYETLSTGEKIYLANKLYKEDRIVAQKVRSHLPEEILAPKEPPLTLRKGDVVRVTSVDYNADEAFVKEGAIGIVTQVDDDNTTYPYGVALADGKEWFRPVQLEKMRVEL